MAITEYPRCAGYLKAMRFRLDDPAMTDYGWAVALSENWTDEFLVEDGRVNFDTMDGPSILVEFERLLRDGRQATANGLSPDDMDSLKAFLGSRGVKVSKLQGDDDYRKAARVLWGKQIGVKASLSELLATIRKMSKRQRQEARTNIQKLPPEWRAA